PRAWDRQSPRYQRTSRSTSFRSVPGQSIPALHSLERRKPANLCQIGRRLRRGVDYATEDVAAWSGVDRSTDTKLTRRSSMETRPTHAAAGSLTVSSTRRHTIRRQGAMSVVWNSEYFSDMSLADWIGIGLFA